jgi:hypothetical protein
MDTTSTIQLARTLLDDFNRRRNQRRVSEEDTALQLQIEYIESAIQALEDAAFARSLDEGAERNHPGLRGEDEWEAVELLNVLTLLTGSVEESDASLSVPKSVFSVLVHRLV